MDTLAENMIDADKGFEMTPSFKIPALLWVDDVATCTEGSVDQKNVLEEIDEFAVKHKLEWGAHKCKVMRVGRHQEKATKWNLGKLHIEETTQYRYLGDEITNNGRNGENIKSRKQKLQGTLASINTIASNEVLNRVESVVLLELHEKIAIPGLLNNSQSWVLNKTETKELEKTEIQALKNLFQLPLRTPNAAIIFTLGTLFTKQRVDQNHFLYIHRILQRPSSHWTIKMLLTLEELNIGWAANIKALLLDYQLPTNFDEIKNTPRPVWTNMVKNTIESRHIARLKTECHKTTNGIKVIKTKTATIVPEISKETYVRRPQSSIIQTTKKETRTIMMARYGLLECGKNFKGTHPEMCDQCYCLDDENHCINYCIKWRSLNMYDSLDKILYDDIYSNDNSKIGKVTSYIEKIWNIVTAQGTMNICQQ